MGLEMSLASMAFPGGTGARLRGLPSHRWIPTHHLLWRRITGARTMVVGTTASFSF